MNAVLLPLFLLAAADPVEMRTRTFRFTYGATVTGLEPGQTARIWVPFPATSSDQRIELIEQNLPGRSQIAAEPRFNNRILYFEAQAGDDGMIPFRLTYFVKRSEARGDSSRSSREYAELFLKPDAMIPAEGKHTQLLNGKNLPGDSFEAARALYDLVNGELTYSKKGTDWGRGDVNWVCDSKYGNCTDFHSLFIGLVRTRKIPGKFEIGFPLPPARGSGEIAGYHCWAKFLIEGKGWIPVDISMANQDAKLKDYCFGNLTEDRVTFSEGRDLQLVPQQDGPPLNYFVFPYVEVNKKPLPAERIVRKMVYEDVKTK